MSVLRDFISYRHTDACDDAYIAFVAAYNRYTNQLCKTNYDPENVAALKMVYDGACAAYARVAESCHLTAPTTMNGGA